MIGFNQENATYKGVGLSRNNLIANDIPFLNLATGDRSTSDYMNQWPSVVLSSVCSMLTTTNIWYR